MTPSTASKAAPARPPPLDGPAADRLRFLLAWARSPLATAAQAPSGEALARAMAAPLDPGRPGLVLELGAGTGAFTRALLARGVAEERLVLVESSPEFAGLLRRRFPRACVVEGCAYGAPGRLAREGAALAGTVSGLPLVQAPPARRLRLVLECLRMSGWAGPFVQFTYLPGSPVPLLGAAGRRALRARRTATIWPNLWPARVWTYRAAAPPGAAAAPPGAALRV